MLKNISSDQNSNQTEEIKNLERILAQSQSPPKLVSASGEEIVLPESVYQILENVVRKMVAGEDICLFPGDKPLTTQEAADFLNVSRPYLIKLLDRGEIPCDTVGNHRRVALEDLVKYKQIRRSIRKKDLQKMTEFLQDEGFYEYNRSDDSCD